MDGKERVLDASKAIAVSKADGAPTSNEGNLSRELRNKGLCVSNDFVHEVVANEILEFRFASP